MKLSGTDAGLALAERRIFAVHYGLATFPQLMAGGLSRWQVRTALEKGRWVRVGHGLYALPAWPRSEERRLLAACLLTGGVASHASAAWLWGLAKEPPPVPVVSVGHRKRLSRPNRSRRSGRPVLAFAEDRLGSFVLRRSRDLTRRHVSIQKGIPVTNPLRTAVDLAASASPESFDEAVDAMLSRGLATVEALEAEISRTRRPGRRGPACAEERLRMRGFTGAPSPSVLESMALRLLRANGIPVLACEVVMGDDGRYRLDMRVAERVFLEFDGFAYHWSPEQKRYDDARRNELRLAGNQILVYDWRAVVFGGARVVRDAHRAIAASNSNG
jgi:hypothetical protein